METLNIKLLNETAKLYYTTNDMQIERNDSGYDLYYCDKSVILQPFETVSLNLGIACELDLDTITHVHGYELLSRSSIVKTPLILGNGIGLIDFGYRGELKACVKNVSLSPYEIVKGSKLFQLCMPNKRPFKVEIIDELSETIRGTGGFGSTNDIQVNMFKDKDSNEYVKNVESSGEYYYKQKDLSNKTILELKSIDNIQASDVNVSNAKIKKDQTIDSSIPLISTEHNSIQVEINFGELVDLYTLANSKDN